MNKERKYSLREIKEIIRIDRDGIIIRGLERESQKIAYKRLIKNINEMQKYPEVFRVDERGGLYSLLNRIKKRIDNEEDKKEIQEERKEFEELFNL